MMAFERTSLSMPAEVFVASGDGSGAKQITHHNDALLAGLELNPAETFWFEGALDTKIEAMLIRPPKFDAAKKYPLLVLLHGGPETMWSNAWGYRWNAQVFSAAGYVTLMINRHGSTGLWAEIYGRDCGGLGRGGVYRCDEGRGLYPGKLQVCGWGADGGGGRILRRIYGGLDCDAHGSVQSDYQPCGCLRFEFGIGDGRVVV